MMKKVIGGGSSISTQLCSLYFKGLVGDDSLAGFGVAICGEKDDLLFQMKGPITGSDITVLEAELTALKRVLTEAVTLGINHISIYFDSFPVYRLVTGSSVLEENNSGMLLNDVQLIIRERSASISMIFVARERIRYAYELAGETIVSQISISMDHPGKPKPTRKKTCSICLDDDVNADQMFSVGKCRHQFCSECMRRHIEVRLLERSLMKCPQYGCKSRLNFATSFQILTPKLREMWEKRIREDSIPVVDRVYCPNPKCSALMSKTKLSKSSTKENAEAHRRCCFQCNEPFCFECKVPWHSDLGCNDYKRLHPNQTANEEKLKALANRKMWRQCGKCQHMIELSQGCVRVKCRCGHNFCYQCGAGAGECPHGHGHLPPPTEPPPPAPQCAVFGIFAVLLLLFFSSFFFFFGEKFI